MPIESRSTKARSSYNYIPIDKIDLSSCVTDSYEVKTGSKKPCVAFDFETYQGFGILLADSTGRFVCSANPKVLFNFLLRKGLQKTFNFFYNIQYDFQALIKYLPLNAYRTLYATGKCILSDYLRQGYDLVISYIPKKCFTLTHRNKSRSSKSYTRVDFFDLAQFYEMSLDLAGKKYSDLKKGGQDLDASRINTSLRYWQDHYNEIVEYCIQDCRVTQSLAERVQDTTFKQLHFYPKRYTSKAGVALEYVLLNTKLPDIHKISKKVLDYAMKAYSGGWFECMAKGSFNKLYLYDINSAYPSEIQKLIDITRGEWRTVKEPNQDAYYGIYRCKVSIPDDDDILPPIPFRTKTNHIIRPVGEFHTTLHKCELEAYQEKIDINVINGVEFFPNEIVEPFRSLIDTLYTWKQTLSKNNYEYAYTKKIMNSIYGKTYEKIPQRSHEGNWFRAGKAFNPVYAGLITAGTRVQMWETAQQRPTDIVAAATDGIISQSPLHVSVSTNLGDWSFEGSGKGEVLQNGIYKFNDGYKDRGVRSGTIFVKNGNGYNKYDHLLQYVEDHTSYVEYPYQTQKVSQFGETILHHVVKSKWDLNIFGLEDKTLNLNNEIKRVFLDQFKNGEDFLSRNIYGYSHSFPDIT